MLKFGKILRLKSNWKGGRISNAAGLGGKPKEMLSNAKLLENFEDLFRRRESEVKRSIIVKVDSHNLNSNVYHYCKQFGGIVNAIAYSLKDGRKFILIEYESEAGACEAYKHVGFSNEAVPWQNQYVTLRKSSLGEPNSQDSPIQFSHVQEPNVINILKSAESIDEQISLLYQHTCINDTLTRLKFIGAMQVQRIINQFMPTIFPKAQIYPFGSTLNGYGRMGSDLDVAMRYDMTGSTKMDEGSVLNFHTRPMYTDGELRKLRGRQVRCMAALIGHYFSSARSVKYLSSARVPLVSYNDLNIPCSVDLSIDNLTGFPDTQLMYVLGVLDARVRPFIFLVRRWAREFKITRHGPGDRFTNFQLSYISLSFLQNLQEPVIPTVDDMIKMMSAYGTGEQIDLKDQLFIFDLNRIQFESKNTSSIFELFYQFLEYYQSYDFQNRMVTLQKKGIIPKPRLTPLYIENIFDTEATVGDNISESEITTLKIMMRETLDELDNLELEPNGSDEWGLLGLLLHLKS